MKLSVSVAFCPTFGSGMGNIVAVIVAPLFRFTWAVVTFMTCFLAEFLCCNLADNRNKFIAVKLQKLLRSWKVAEFFFEME